MKYILPRLLIVVLFVSCYKDQSIFIPDQTYTINNDLFLSRFIAAPTSYLVNLQLGKTIVHTSENMIVEIPYEGLIDQQGEVVEGEIKIEIKNFSDKTYNLLRSPRLVYENQLIFCKKMFYISLSQNGQTIFAKKPVSVYLKDVNENTNGNSQLFSSSDITNNTNWHTENNDNFEIKAQNWSISNVESVISFYGYKISIGDNNNWYCISDKLSGESPKNQQISVSFDAIINHHNTIAYFVSDHYNTVVKLEDNDKNRRFNLTFASLKEPISGKIILLSQLGDEIYHFGMTNVVLGKDETINVKSEPKDIKDIKAILTSL